MTNFWSFTISCVHCRNLWLIRDQKDKQIINIKCKHNLTLFDSQVKHDLAKNTPNKLNTQLTTCRWRNIKSWQIHMLNKIAFKTYSVLFKQY